MALVGDKGHQVHTDRAEGELSDYIPSKIRLQLAATVASVHCTL